MTPTRRVCINNSQVSREWEERGHLLYGHRNVADNMGWQASLPTAQDRQDEKDLARGVCPLCFCVIPVAGRCCD